MFKSYRVNKNLRPAAAAEPAASAAAYEPVQKHKVTPGIPGWLNDYKNVIDCRTILCDWIEVNYDSIVSFYISVTDFYMDVTTSW